MDQHPVPQNVTSFQFHLFGDMTMKQFGYVAIFGALAVVIYSLPLPRFLTLPLAAASALLGFGLAFVPIEDRPMDILILAFLKSVFSPTQYVWHRADSTGAAEKLPAATVLTPVDAALPTRTQTPAQGQPPPKTAPKKGLFSRLLDLIAPPAPKTKPAGAAQPVPPPKTPQPAPPPIPAAIPEPVRPVATPTITGAVVSSVPTGEPPPSPKKPAEDRAEVEKKPTESQKTRDDRESTKTRELEEKLRRLEEGLRESQKQSGRIAELQSQLTSVLSERERMEAELVALRNKIRQTSSAPVTTRDAGVVANASKQPTIKVITPENAVRSGLPRLTTVPNVVTGIIKDHENNLLSGVLVTVKDRDGMPVRALKTNKLGQFAASTPLSNNTYFVEVEDPKNTYLFDRIQITLTGSVIPPIEVIAKSQRDIDRRKLEEQIFGNQT